MAVRATRCTDEHMQRAVLGGGLIFVAVLGVLTVVVLIDTGPDVLTITSLVIIALLGFGLYSAMQGPPE